MAGNLHQLHKTSMQEDNLMELLWQNGQVVLNSLHPSSSTVVNTDESSPPQEEEMASWLHYPFEQDNTFRTDFCSDLLYPSSSTGDLTMTTSSAETGGSANPNKPLVTDRKRKQREHDDDDEDARFEETETKKQVHGSASARRSRAAEVHNLSERRRQDRINEKMKALQGLIPWCNKSDKASMLDEAIEYLKSLQLQVQMMSMRCSMMPMVFPGVQPYMGPMGMGMGMNRPMMTFPQVIADSSMPRTAAAAHFGPRFPIPAYHHQSGSSHDVTRMRPDQSDPSLNPIGIQSPNPMQLPFSDSYQCYPSHFNMQAPPCPPQTHTMGQASTSKGVENQENPKHG